MLIPITLSGCFNFSKTAITSQEFKKKMEEKGFTVTDAKSQFSEYDYILSATLAIEKSSNYKIEFYELNTEDNAKAFYNNNKDIFEEESSNSINAEVSGLNYSKLTLEANGKYKVIVQVDKTAIYLNIDSGYKDEVKEILDDLGY